MPHSVACPGCGANLVIPEGTKSPSLTCPQCLAAVAVARAGQAPTQPEGSGLRAGVAPQDVPCPSCGYPIRGTWRVCPQCGKRTRQPNSMDEHDLPDVDVSRDQEKVRIGLPVLGILGALGTLGVFIRLRSVGEPQLAILTGVFLLIFFGVGMGGVLLVKRARRLSPDNTGCAVVFIVVGICVALFGFALFVLGFAVCGFAPMR